MWELDEAKRDYRKSKEEKDKKKLINKLRLCKNCRFSFYMTLGMYCCEVTNKDFVIARSLRCKYYTNVYETINLNKEN